jgi:membrane fusion protein (multidrug efflux system)/multidrug efflux system membrane fusion protein
MMRAVTGMHAAAALLGASALTSSCADPAEQPAATAHPVQAGSSMGAAPPTSSREEAFLGVVLAREAVELSAPFEGRLARIHVQPGDRVKARTALASMALEPLRGEELMAQAQLEQAEAELNRAELEASEATERLQRYQKSPPGALSADELSEARYQEKIALTQVASLRARIRERRAGLGQIRQRLSEAEILAPFDCTVAVRYLDPGARVQAGMPVLRLLQASEFRVRFALPEGRSGSAAPGLPVSIFLPALGKAFPGQISSIAPEVDAASRMVFALATLHAPTDAVRAGMAARVSLGPELSSVSPSSVGGQPAKRSGE